MMFYEQSTFSDAIFKQCNVSKFSQFIQYNTTGHEISGSPRMNNNTTGPILYQSGWAWRSYQVRETPPGVLYRLSQL